MGEKRNDNEAMLYQSDRAALLGGDPAVLPALAGGGGGVPEADSLLRRLAVLTDRAGRSARRPGRTGSARGRKTAGSPSGGAGRLRPLHG